MHRTFRLLYVPLLAAAIAIGAAAPATAQVQLQALGGATSAAARAPFYAGALGVKFTLLEFDAEVGRLHNVLPSGVLDALRQLEQQHGVPVRVTASVPATYGLLGLRLISPGGFIQPFVSAGVGIAHLEPRLNVAVDGISFGDVFGVTALRAQNRPMAAAGAGLRFDFGPVNVEGGYRVRCDLQQVPSKRERVKRHRSHCVQQRLRRLRH